MRFSSRFPFAILFFGLLIFIGIGCRFVGLLWDEGAQLHPDERFCLNVLMQLQWPVGWNEFFNSQASPLNPANINGVHYVYGQLPLFIAKTVQSARGIEDAASFSTTARALSALFDCFTVGFTILLARRLLRCWKWALFAGSLVSLAALHVQQSHFFTTDNFAACFLTASFWAGARFLDEHRTRDAAWMGAFWGLALACKISAGLFGIAIVAFLILGAHARSSTKDVERSSTKQSWMLSSTKTSWILSSTICFAMALLAFRLGHPMAFRGEILGGILDLRPDARFWNEVANQGAITRGAVDVPFNVQWIGTTRWVFAWKQLGFWGYGWLLWLSGVAGIALFLAFKNEKFASSTPEHTRRIWAIAALWALFLFLVQGAAFSKFTRYYLPLTPFVALFAALVWRELETRFRWARAGTGVVACSTLAWCLAVTSITTRPHTRMEASRWIVANIAPGTVVANETPWDESLPLGWMPQGDGKLKFLLLDSYDPDTPQKREKLARTLDEAQWIFFSSARSYANIPRWREKWPMTSQFYDALWDGKLGFEKAREFTNYPQLGPLKFPDDYAEEALWVYDHPRVTLWRKRRDYSGETVRGWLNAAPLSAPRAWKPNEATF